MGAIGQDASKARQRGPAPEAGRIRTRGLAAAVGGALVGGWLGFNATNGLLAVITTIVGATVGANLLLLALGIWQDRQVRDRVVETKTTERVEELIASHWQARGKPGPHRLTRGWRR